MSFSDRLGITKPKSILQVGEMDTGLRNGLWQACIESFFHDGGRGNYEYDQLFRTIMDRTYVDFFKSTSEDVPYGYANGNEAIRNWFFRVEWWQVYNFLEFLTSEFDQAPFCTDGSFSERLSFFLEREKSGMFPEQPALQLIYDTAPIGLACLSPDCRYLQINQRLTTIAISWRRSSFGHESSIALRCRTISQSRFSASKRLLLTRGYQECGIDDGCSCW